MFLTYVHPTLYLVRNGKPTIHCQIDGNGWSGRFKRLITSNSMIFKSTVYPEWYVFTYTAYETSRSEPFSRFANRVQPWVHYVPIQIDLTDLHDVFIFFRGDGNGEGAHENLARKIAVAGREWSKSFWRKEDLIAYMYRFDHSFTCHD